MWPSRRRGGRRAVTPSAPPGTSPARHRAGRSDQLRAGAPGPGGEGQGRELPVGCPARSQPPPQPRWAPLAVTLPSGRPCVRRAHGCVHSTEPGRCVPSGALPRPPPASRRPTHWCRCEQAGGPRDMGRHLRGHLQAPPPTRKWPLASQSDVSPGPAASAMCGPRCPRPGWPALAVVVAQTRLPGLMRPTPSPRLLGVSTVRSR